jgi:hypothetical protein
MKSVIFPKESHLFTTCYLIIFNEQNPSIKSNEIESKISWRIHPRSCFIDAITNNIFFAKTGRNVYNFICMIWSEMIFHCRSGPTLNYYEFSSSQSRELLNKKTSFWKHFLSLLKTIQLNDKRNIFQSTIIRENYRVRYHIWQPWKCVRAFS